MCRTLIQMFKTEFYIVPIQYSKNTQMEEINILSILFPLVYFTEWKLDIAHILQYKKHMFSLLNSCLRNLAKEI